MSCMQVFASKHHRYHGEQRLFQGFDGFVSLELFEEPNKHIEELEQYECHLRQRRAEEVEADSEGTHEHAPHQPCPNCQHFPRHHRTCEQGKSMACHSRRRTDRGHRGAFQLHQGEGMHWSLVNSSIPGNTHSMMDSTVSRIMAIQTMMGCRQPGLRRSMHVLS